MDSTKQSDNHWSSIRASIQKSPNGWHAGWLDMDSLASILRHDTVDSTVRKTIHEIDLTGKRFTVTDDRLPSVFLRMPNTAFGIPLAIAGQVGIWRSLCASQYKSLFLSRVAEVYWFTACILYGVVSICYAYKAYMSFKLVQDEYRHQVRAHFFNTPILVLISLCSKLPPSIFPASDTSVVLRTIWGVCFCYQTILTTNIYKMFMFDAKNNFTTAKPQFLLSAFGWFELSCWGNVLHIKSVWGIGLPTFCFGAGLILYFDLVCFIFKNLHTDRNLMGSGALYLIIALPAAGVHSIISEGGFPISAEMLLGWILVVFILLLRLGPKIYGAPTVLGEYWAYISPMSGAAFVTIKYADVMGTPATIVLEVIMLVIANASLLVVLMRSSCYAYWVARGTRQWTDPLFKMEHYNSRNSRLETEEGS